MVPRPLIILPFLVAFVLTTYQYYKIDPMRRLLNVRAGLMIGAILCAFGYPIYTFLYPDDRRMSWVFFGLAVAWLVTSYYLLRRVPPTSTD